MPSLRRVLQGSVEGSCNERPANKLKYSRLFQLTQIFDLSPAISLKLRFKFQKYFLGILFF